jgi:hypothetical protein
MLIVQHALHYRVLPRGGSLVVVGRCFDSGSLFLIGHFELSGSHREYGCSGLIGSLTSSG